MTTNKKLIVLLIVGVVIILAALIAFAPKTTEETQTAYEIPLEAKDFHYFEMEIPVDSNFVIKNSQVEVGKGMVSWQNTGNFSNETDSIMISKNYTEDIMANDNMKLISSNGSQKTYAKEGTVNDEFMIVRTVGGVDIIASGRNDDLLQKMLATVKVKTTDGLYINEPIKHDNSTPANKTNHTNDTSKNAKSTNKTKSNNVKTTTKTTKTTKTTTKTTKTTKTTTKTKNNVKTTTDKKKDKNVETTTDKATDKNVETTTDKGDNVETTSQSKSSNKIKASAAKEDIVIGGGSFTTGSGLEDKTHARIYLGMDHAGEDVKIKIIYSRDGVNLNHGNLVDATIKDDGYVNITSADAYSKYPDYATVKVYDESGKLLNTQGIGLTPTNGTQYF